MILSTVNFVNNYKFSDFILTKITEEQKEIDSETVKKTKRHSFGALSRRESDNISRKRASLRDRRSPDVGKQTEKGACADVSAGDLVSIETADGYMLEADYNMCHVRLCRQTTVSTKNVFKRVKIEEGSTDHLQLFVFQLHNNSSYYLATSPEMGLQIQSYCADTLDLSLPDERMFLCHEHSSGAVFVQPFLQTGLYLHHRDQQISLRKFELDLRPPEEYFLHVNSVSAHTLAQIETATSLGTETANDAGNSEQETHTLDQEARKYSSKSFWRRGSKKKDKTKESPITPQPGPLSCFGVSVRKKKKSRKFWR